MYKRIFSEADDKDLNELVGELKGQFKTIKQVKGCTKFKKLSDSDKEYVIDELKAEGFKESVMKESNFDTAKKTADSIGKIFKVKAFGKNDKARLEVPLKFENMIEKTLIKLGFNKFKNELKQKWITSYINESNIIVEFNTEYDYIDIDVYKYTKEKLPFIPYD